MRLRRRRQVLCHLLYYCFPALLVALPGSVRGSGRQASAQVVTTGTLLVSLDARDTSAGTATWENTGSLGAFHRVGAPVMRTMQGARAVCFDGIHDAYQGPASIPVIEGQGTRSIEVWAYASAIAAGEETLVAWGRRGGPAGANMEFSYGRSPNYGAVAHWAADMGWNGVPAPGQWHYLVYTYDGTTARIYDNAAEKNALRVRLRTAPGYSVNVGVQNSAQGGLQFINEYNGESMGGKLCIAEVRVETGVLTAEQIRHNFQAEAQRFGATALTSARDLLLNSGMLRLTTRSLTLQVSKATQEAFSLMPVGTRFDFLPSDRLEGRAFDGFYQLGDIDFRTQTPGGSWQSFSTAAHHAPVRPLPLAGGLAADLAPSLGPGCPLQVTREWIAQDGDLVMRFVLRNPTAQPVTLGAFGAAMVVNNILTGRSLEETHEKCAFADPYVGGEAGYLQVTRLNGKGPVLLVLPEKGTGFEAYRPLHDDPTPRDVTFEGFYEWTVHSRAYAEDEWKFAQEEWNTPTERVLQPGESVSYGFRFVLAPGVRGIEPTLISRKRPVVVGIPGYVLPTDQQSALFVHAPSAVRNLRVEPAGALRIAAAGRTVHGWLRYALTGIQAGRCRLTLTYRDGVRQFVHVFVTPPAAEQVRRFGAFSAANQWFTDPIDPFGRTFSFMPYLLTIHRQVLQHPATWMVGLSDEMGAGPNLAMAVKNLGQPDPQQIKMLEQYVDHALWGRLQYPDYGVRASLFYYDPKAFPNYYIIRSGWDKARSETTWRSFNYPHQAAIYWCLYRLARDHQGLVTAHPWSWYLRQAYRTAMAMGTHAGPPPGGLQQFGQMVGDVYLRIIEDCRREGWTKEANDLEGYERIRAEHFRSLQYPYGSEMPWDSTGQEEVYLLCRYFGFDDKAQMTVNAVLAYDPTVPNWGYNGAARRYFDEAVNQTEWPDIMRLLHHYGGGMNAIPVLASYRDHPDDFYLLRVGYGGTLGALTDIDDEGFGSQCFDPDPAIMRFDPYVGDYGIEFYGFAYNTGAYIVHHPEFGWMGFGCNITPQGARIAVTPCDAFRSRLYVAPFGLYLTLDAGTFQRALIDPAHKTVRLTLSPRTSATPTALLRIQTARSQARSHAFAPTPILATVRGAYAIPLSERPVTILLRAVK
ncbi:MAG TPA: DUF5695 domain-containing protein [Chthonomonadaceae bacterium]|nr:DUF5695 domain-containing protein [Chthonomonadaceae bacterium]